MPKKQTVPVSMRALTQRINRVLAKREQQLKRPRSDRALNDLGDHYILDRRRNSIVRDHVDPETLGREMGVLEAWEEVSHD